MRKFILMLVLFVLHQFAFAQGKGFTLQPRVGLIFSDVSVGELKDVNGKDLLKDLKFDPGTGFTVGLRANVGVNERFTVWAEPNFSRRIFYDRSQEAGLSSDQGVLTVIQDPTFIFKQNRYSFYTGVTYNCSSWLRVAVGPYAHLVENQTIKIENYSEDKEAKVFKEYDFGLAANIDVQKGPILAFVRFERGVINTSNIKLTDDQGVPILRPKFISFALSFGVGYTF